MLVPMAKVIIIGLRQDFDDVLVTLHRLGTLELRPLAPPPPIQTALRPAAPDQGEIDRLASLAERLGALLAYAPVPPTGPDAQEPGGLSEAQGRTDASAAGPASGPSAAPLPDVRSIEETAERLLGEIEPEVRRLASRRAALEVEAATLRSYQEILEHLLPLGDYLPRVADFETTFFIIQPAFQDIIPVLRQELDRITERQSEIATATAEDGATACMVVYHRRFREQVHAVLQSEQLNEVRLPPAYEGRPFRETLEEVVDRLGTIPNEIEALGRQLEAYVRPRRAEIALVRDLLLDRLDELRAASQCLCGTHAFALAGWVPEPDLPLLERALDEHFNGRLRLERLPIERSDWAEMPVLIRNPPLVRPFQLLLAMFPSPRYGTIDPTPFVAFFFPLFFGFILGDIGYGLVLLVLAQWVHGRRVGAAALQQVARVARVAALAAIVFGAAYGEFFGDLGHRFGLRPLIVDRAEAIPALLLFSVGLGIVQVSIGLVLGILNSVMSRHYQEAVSRSATLAGLLLTCVALAVLGGLLPRGLLTPSLVLLSVTVALLILSVGVLGPLEVLGVLGNILSYTRLVAVGLASVILAQVANDLAGLTGSIILGAIVAVLLHGLNLTLGLFSPTVQSLRLQYVEFFGRFFQPGGTPFQPFRSRFLLEHDRPAPA